MWDTRISEAPRKGYAGRRGFGMVYPACVFFLISMLSSVTLQAQDTPLPAPGDTAASSQEPEQSPGAQKASPWQNRWYFFVGPANVHARLKESEAEINHQLNDTFGRIIPGWKDPTTFKDYSNQLKLWDLHLGLGRDISPKWSWFVDGGGIIGSVKNHDSYWFYLAPLKTKIDFNRNVWFVAGGLDYYPWGKPDLDTSSGSSKLTRSLMATKPFFELAAGHVHVKEVADVKFSIKYTPFALSQYKEIRHDVNYISPRIGVETPFTKNDSLVLETGYLFFDAHPSDFNNLSVYFIYHHKF
jgi:hypothetical protein